MKHKHWKIHLATSVMFICWLSVTGCSIDANELHWAEEKCVDCGGIKEIKKEMWQVTLVCKDETKFLR